MKKKEKMWNVISFFSANMEKHGKILFLPQAAEKNDSKEACGIIE